MRRNSASQNMARFGRAGRYIKAKISPHLKQLWEFETTVGDEIVYQKEFNEVGFQNDMSALWLALLGAFNWLAKTSTQSASNENFLSYGMELPKMFSSKIFD